MAKYFTRSGTPLTYKQIIWNNQKILTNGKVVFWKNWFDQNIIRFTARSPSREREIPVLERLPFILHFGLIISILTS